VAPAPPDPRIRLRPLVPGDHEALAAMELRPGLAGRGRFQGRVPSPGEYAHLLWAADALLQTVVCDASGGEPIGFITTYDVDLRNQTAYLAMASAQEPRHRGLVMAGALAQVQELFVDWPFRKLYVDVAESNLDQFASGLRSLFQLEGTLVADRATPDGYEDRHVYALYRERWLEQMAPLVRRRQQAVAAAAGARAPIQVAASPQEHDDRG
jgi:hypothetical protein